jgi:hypothetical protein
MREGNSAADNARELEDVVDACFTWGEENAVAFYLFIYFLFY